MDIIIPSCKPLADLQPLIQEILETATGAFNLKPISGVGKSAAENRNAGLRQLPRSDYIVMLDDDITGLKPGWNEKLVRPLVSDPFNIGLIAARLMNPDGSLGYMNSRSYDLSAPIAMVTYAPSACIAFKNIGLWFDERFIGSGFEDTDFCMQYRKLGFQIAINNEVRVIHRHEQKNQKPNWGVNRQKYQEKWG